jgi:hypothetical protein
MKKRSRIQRLLLASLMLAAAIPFFAFGLSNLFLSSPKGRLFMAGKIQARTGLETSVGGSSWSPWNGVSLYGIRIEQPAPLNRSISSPLLTVELIRITPAWSPLLRHKQLIIKGMDIKAPRLSIPIELLSQIPRQQVEPQIAANEAPPIPAGKTPQPEASIPVAPAAPVDTSLQPSVSALPEEKAPSKESLEENAVPTIWINFTKGSMRIVSTKAKTPLYEISAIDGALPVEGKSAESLLKLKGIKCLGNDVASAMDIPLKWRTPLLQLGNIEGKLFGIDCLAGASISLTRGIPFQISALLPEQKDKEIHIGESLDAKLGAIAGQGNFQGLLIAPGTWRGQWIAQSSAMNVEYGDYKNDFDQGQAIVIFQNGALSCVDARLSSEALSIIGNATLLSDGRAAANARVIAAPDTLVAFSKFTEPASNAPSLTPLSTPQRAALDLQIFGKLGELYFKPNPRSQPILIR